MKLSARGRYAVMALVDLCETEQKNFSGAPLPLKVIAHNQGLSLGYLEQLFMCLKKAKIVNSIRGASGGYCLALPPHELTLAAIFESVNETFTATACGSGKKKACLPNRGRCRVHHVWTSLEKKVEAYFHSVTLGFIVDNLDLSHAACLSPEAVSLSSHPRDPFESLCNESSSFCRTQKED